MMFKFITPIALSLSSSSLLYAEKIPVYLGSGSENGISLVTLDTETGALSDLKTAATISGPGSLTLSKDKKTLYAAARLKGQREGIVAAFARAEDNSLKLINQQSSGGAGACHVSLDKDSSFLFVANYSGGCVSSFSVAQKENKGALSKAVSHIQHTGSSINPQRQKKPHAHSIYSSPDGKFVYAADLGTDDVFIYKLDQTSGKLTPSGSAKVPLGGGPRHMTFSKNGDKLYVLNELTLTISRFARDAKTGGLNLEVTKPVMAKIEEGISCSEIQISQDGKFIYAACRDLLEQKRDTISVIKVEDLSILQEHATGVWIPRHFGISPSGKWLLIAGQRANQVIVHARDPETGKLTKTDHTVEVEKPMWILFP